MDFILDEDLENQEWLLKASTERYEVAYLKARRKGLKDPVIFLLDLRDAYACDLVRSMTDGAALDESLKRADRGVLPIMTTFMSLASATALLAKDFGDICHGLKTWPFYDEELGAPVVVIGNGVVSLASCQMPIA